MNAYIMKKKAGIRVGKDKDDIKNLNKFSGYLNDHPDTWFYEYTATIIKRQTRRIYKPSEMINNKELKEVVKKVFLNYLNSIRYASGLYKIPSSRGKRKKSRIITAMDTRSLLL